MKHYLPFLSLCCLFFASSGFSMAQTVFINEIHYDNDGGDTEEGVEVAGPLGTDLTGWSLVAYNGNGGTVYTTINLSGTLENQQGGYGQLFFPISGLQNGSPDGIALVNASKEVVQFLSYEGTLTATEGPALNRTSEEIGVEESGGTPIGFSLQLEGTGTEYPQFNWSAATAKTYNAANNNQTFTASGDGGDSGGGDSGEEPEPEEPANIIAYINEIHYDNNGSDVEEGVEIAALAQSDLTGWSLVLYNGNNQEVYETINVSGVVEDQQSGFGTLFVPASGLQNGGPDGIALVNAEGQVVQFLSYEGSFMAIGGPADGRTSEDIGVEEGSGTPAGFSLQLTGEGSNYQDFDWAEASTKTYGQVNTNQTFLPLEPIVFINEFHYDNSGSDVNEGIEIAGTTGTDLSAYSIVLYNGNNGSSYQTISLSGILPNYDNGYGTLFFFTEGLQNGAPDGSALIKNENQEVIQFLSYEGSFTAIGGPADGMESEMVGEETSSTPSGYSLQLAGEGRKYADFNWEGPIPNTYNQINTNQSFGGEVVTPEPVEVSIAEARELSIGKQVIVEGVLTVTSQHGGPAFIQDATGGIAVYDLQIHANDSLQIGDSVRIAASIGAFNEQVQLVDVTALEKVGESAGPVEPKVVTIAELAVVEGELVTLQNVSFTKAEGLLFPNSNYTIQDETGTTEVRIDDNVESLIGKKVPEGSVIITGVVGSFQGNIQLLPRFEADLPAAEPFEPAGDTIPANATFDVASWNMEFFGATQDNFGPANIQLQLENAVKVIKALNADIIAVQEVSSDSLLNVLANQLEGNWAIRCSDVYSYSFEPADPTFPAQKLCYLYNTEVVEVVEERVVFEEFYTEVRTSGNESLLPDYPTTVSSFWASGRLPYQLTVNATVNGVTETINLFNIHGISNSGGLESYERRTYDVQVLKDTLDTYYQGEAIIILGDYNDDVDEPVADEVSSDVSPYEIFVYGEDYAVATASLSEAGFRSYVFQDNMIDHITISDELFQEWIRGSETTFIPFTIVENYSGTTSDHLPVRVRFELMEPLVVTASENAKVFSGYEPAACTTLEASATGGKGAYTYTWSTGETTAAIEVCPSDSRTYSVVVEDAIGNSIMEEVNVCVVDVSCGNGRGIGKVELCYTVGRRRKRQVSLCLPERLVPHFLKRGAVLGSCGEQNDCEVEEGKEQTAMGNNRMKSADPSTMEIEEVLSVYREIGSHQVTVQFVILEEGATELFLYNVEGRRLKTLYRGGGDFGSVQEIELEDIDLRSGMYFLQLQTATGAVFTKKLML